MEGPKVKQEKGKAVKTVRFRVASANSGRVLTEVFKDETAWCGSVSDSVDSDCTSTPEAEQGSSLPASEANSHLNGLVVETAVDENGCEPDDLLLYASAKREMLFSNKRINICSKNGTIRGVRNKVSAGQVLFNNLSNMYSSSLRHQKRRPWEKEQTDWK
ncbi:glutaredoxin domain-containing cysteine-rich protein 1-like isoform X1 [Lates japonicus]